MSEYKNAYHILWQAITHALNELQLLNIGTAKELLVQAQIDAEESYISYGEDEQRSSLLVLK